MTFTTTMEWVTMVFEAVGVGVLLVGLVYALGRWAVGLVRHTPNGSYVELRNTIGFTILLALEILVAADIVRTLAVDPTVENVAVLGLIVLIRTFLSFSLEIEIDGMAPWQRAKMKLLGTAKTMRATDEKAS